MAKTKLNYDDLRAKLEDTDKLHIETWLLEQPSLALTVCDYLGDAYNAKAEAELELKLLEPRKNLEIREALVAKGAKTTEDSVKAAIGSDPEIAEALIKIRETQAEHQKWSNLKQQFDTKMECVNNLTKLIVCGYLAQ